MKTDRRKLIKALTLGGGAVTAARLPSTWTTPVVDSVVLPAHAQTTVGPALSGGTTITLDDNGLLRYRDFVQDPGSSNPLLDRIISAAHAGIEFEPGDSTTRLTGYAERDIGRGNGWWLVQLLVHTDFFAFFAANETRATPPTPLDSLLTPAHALGISPEECVIERLYQTRVFIDPSDGAPFRSGWKSDVPASDQCGDLMLRMREDDGIDLRLEDADDPDNATTALLAVRGIGKTIERIRLSPGGRRLSVNCGGNACGYEPEEPV